jgi:hypothetical protein
MPAPKNPQSRYKKKTDGELALEFCRGGNISLSLGSKNFNEK